MAKAGVTVKARKETHLDEEGVVSTKKHDVEARSLTH
jgi:hypothetical protein